MTTLFLIPPGIWSIPGVIHAQRQWRLKLVPQAALTQVRSLTTLSTSFPPQGEAGSQGFPCPHSALNQAEGHEDCLPKAPSLFSPEQLEHARSNKLYMTHKIETHPPSKSWKCQSIGHAVQLFPQWEDGSWGVSSCCWHCATGGSWQEGVLTFPFPTGIHVSGCTAVYGAVVSQLPSGFLTERIFLCTVKSVCLWVEGESRTYSAILLSPSRSHRVLEQVKVTTQDTVQCPKEALTRLCESGSLLPVDSISHPVGAKIKSVSKPIT